MFPPLAWSHLPSRRSFLRCSYIHVLDVTTNITRVEVGPATFIKQDNEKVIEGTSSDAVSSRAILC